MATKKVVDYAGAMGKLFLGDCVRFLRPSGDCVRFLLLLFNFQAHIRPKMAIFNIQADTKQDTVSLMVAKRLYIFATTPR